VYIYLNIIRMCKVRQQSWWLDRRRRNAYVWQRKYKKVNIIDAVANTSLENLGLLWEGNIKMDIKEIGWEGLTLNIPRGVLW